VSAKKRASKQTTVLVADDHAVVRCGLRSLLATDPTFRIIGEATNGSETLRIAEKLRPETVVMDISMPGVNGLDVTRKLRRNSPDVKVVIFTIHFSEDVARECLRAGARAYVLKSDADSELLEALRTVRDDQPFFTPRITEMFNARRSSQEYNPEAMRGLSGEIPLERLTMIEPKVVALLCEGMTSNEVASRLGLATRTIECQRGHIMKKLQITVFCDLIRYAIRHGIVSG